MVARTHSRAEIMGKMDPYFTSDALKEQIVDYNKRKQQGQVETYEGSEIHKKLGESLFENRGTVKKKTKEASPKVRSYF